MITMDDELQDKVHDLLSRPYKAAPDERVKGDFFVTVFFMDPSPVGDIVSFDIRCLGRYDFIGLDKNERKMTVSQLLTSRLYDMLYSMRDSIDFDVLGLYQYHLVFVVDDKQYFTEKCGGLFTVRAGDTSIIVDHDCAGMDPRMISTGSFLTVAKATDKKITFDVHRQVTSDIEGRWWVPMIRRRSDDAKIAVRPYVIPVHSRLTDDIIEGVVSNPRVATTRDGEVEIAFRSTDSSLSDSWLFPHVDWTVIGKGRDIREFGGVAWEDFAEISIGDVELIMIPDNNGKFFGVMHRNLPVHVRTREGKKVKQYNIVTDRYPVIVRYLQESKADSSLSASDLMFVVEKGTELMKVRPDNHKIDANIDYWEGEILRVQFKHDGDRVNVDDVTHDTLVIGQTLRPSGSDVIPDTVTGATLTGIVKLSTPDTIAVTDNVTAFFRRRSDGEILDTIYGGDGNVVYIHESNRGVIFGFDIRQRNKTDSFIHGKEYRIDGDIVKFLFAVTGMKRGFRPRDVLYADMTEAIPYHSSLSDAADIIQAGEIVLDTLCIDEMDNCYVMNELKDNTNEMVSDIVITEFDPNLTPKRGYIRLEKIRLWE